MEMWSQHCADNMAINQNNGINNSAMNVLIETSPEFISSTICGQHLNQNINNLDTAKMHRSEPIIHQLNQLNQRSLEFLYEQNNDGDTQLHLSIIMQHVETSLWLVSQASHPGNLNIVNYNHQSALHLAVMVQEPRIVRRLVLAGANMELRTSEGNTALHIACNLGDLECIKALTEPVYPYEKYWIAYYNNVEPLSTLKQTLELQNYSGNTCLHIAASKGHLDIVCQLIRSGANPDARGGHAGMTALHIAVEKGYRQMVYFLATEGRASLDVVTYARATVYQIALDFKQLQIAEDLANYGALTDVVYSSSESENSSDCEFISSDSESSDDFSAHVSAFSKIGLEESLCMT